MTSPEPRAIVRSSVRVDAMTLAIEVTDLDGTRYELLPYQRVTAASTPALAAFASQAGRSQLVVRLRGQCTQAFEAKLVIEQKPLGSVATAHILDAATGDYELELRADVRELPPGPEGQAHRIAMQLSTGQTLTLTQAQITAIAGDAPSLRNFDVLDVTDALLYDALPRKSVDLQNPEEGFWVGSGRFHLRAQADWARTQGGDNSASWRLETTPSVVTYDPRGMGDARDALWENPDKRRALGTITELALVFDTGHEDCRARVTPAGIDVPVRVAVEHELTCKNVRYRLVWRREFNLRLRDPSSLIGSFRRLGAVGIDFGTSATVAAFTSKGFRSLMRLGTPRDDANPAENPTYLLIEDHAAFFHAMSTTAALDAKDTSRSVDLVDLVCASHLAREALRTTPNAVLGELKTLPERVLFLDQSPLLRDRKKQQDFLLDEARVRAVIRAYGYILGRAINRAGQELYLRYWLTWPAEFDDRAKLLLEQELRAGILLSIPDGISGADVSVQLSSSEPEAYAAEVCPELVNHPALEPILSKHGELRFAVFDFGGGTLDIACGRYRPATEQEQQQSGASTVIEVLQVAGNDSLGGDYLTSEMAWLTHQHPKVFAECEKHDVPMQRPATVPENKLARAAHLYKRSLAGRQNQVRFVRELALEQLKFSRKNVIPSLKTLPVVRIDGTETSLTAFGDDNEPIRESLTTHLATRIEEGARLLLSMLQNVPWRGEGDWRTQGVQILLAGNSSRGEYVAQALGRVLGYPDLRVWRPSDPGAPEGVILYETPARLERGVEIIGVSPKTAVALGALKIANREVHLLRAQQGFSYFVGDMRGFPPKFVALVSMGMLPADPEQWGPHYVDCGTWDAQKPLRVAKEYSEGAMSSNDPRLLTIPTGLPAGSTGRLHICVVSPSKIALHLVLADETHVRTELNLAPYLS